MILDRRNFWQAAAMIAAALLLGLGANFVSREPLPLLKALPGPAEAGAVFAEVDADFILQAGNAPGTLLLDARASAAFRLGHIPGALSLPLGEFAASFAMLEPQLRQADLLVVYCSGSTCSDSLNLAGMLRAKGMKSIYLYKGGMEDWSGNGHTVEK
ncbi:MAG: rhodanese-like domain-containing protein [Acidobacteriota bacterium]|nr:rhodanese-like domain-containing protein [Acidobacteriota bacterium]